MKRIIHLFLILSLILLSCEKDPVSSFLSDTDEPEVGQKVFFTNESQNATGYEWDFGDGYISNEENPIHIFNSTGTFDITLTATSKKGIEDKSSLTLSVMIPTLLLIEVRENNDNELVVSDASVRLYPTLLDWDNETNLETEGYTDVDGIVVFSNLKPDDYYVDVWEQNHDNWALGIANENWIRTPEVVPHKINGFIAWVDVVNHGKGTGRIQKSLVIKRMESKPINKRQREAVSLTDDWQELYKRRVVKK